MKEQPEAGNLSVQLGQSKQPRPVKPIEGTLLNPNHIYVTFLSGLGVRECQGCPTPIEQVPAPLDMIFRFRATCPFLNKKTNMWQDRVANAYCHLDLCFLKSFNPNMKMEQIYMDDETFLQCTEEHFKYLREAGLLRAIVDNRSK